MIPFFTSFRSFFFFAFSLSKMTENSENYRLVQEIRTRAEAFQFMHNRSRRWIKCVNIGVFSLPMIIMSAVTGTASFAKAFSDTSSGQFSVDLSMGILEAVTVVLGAVQTYLQLDAKSKEHENALRECLQLISKILHISKFLNLLTLNMKRTRIRKSAKETKAVQARDSRCKDIGLAQEQSKRKN